MTTASAVGRAATVAVVGIEAVDVTVEAHVSRGLPGFTVIGSSGSSAGEAAERVRTALVTVDPDLARRKVLVSLAPADVAKMGARYDLAMGVAVLVQRGIVPSERLHGTALLGELALDGSVRPVHGVLPSAHHLQRSGAHRLILPAANAGEAGWAHGLEVVAVSTLAQTIKVLRGAEPADSPDTTAARSDITGAQGHSTHTAPDCRPAPPDLADVRGQHMARRAIEIAAAGGHHLLLVGPPGCGKSMLAACLPRLLPALSDEDAFALAAVRSVLGRLGPHPELDRRPPLRAPHHTVTAPALLGGGTGVARPGELSLATGGVLFLDELFEWPRAVLDALREPLEEGVVRIARSRATVAYPARVQLVCAANPCPCGPGGAGGGECSCRPEVVARYRMRLSGPLADRLDLAPVMAPLRGGDLQGAPGEASATVASRVRTARALRVDASGTVAARVPARALARTLAPAAAVGLTRAVDAGELTGRGHDRCLAVARTIADLAGSAAIGAEHVDEAIVHRRALRTQADAG